MKRPWRRALAWMAICSLLFAVVYNACNWLTTLRTDVGQWAFPWELRIPFVPWTIVPYWSLDLFFMGSFFLARDRQELDVLGKRLALSTLVGGMCFLLLPLTTLFPRPEVDGFYGMLFASLRAFDRPHNLFPSLHIALRTLLAHHYAKHSRGWVRGLVHGWFFLIGLSTLLTYQHQVMDVVGGFLLALVCFHAVPEVWTPCPPAQNRAIAWRYAIGAAVVASAGWIMRPWGMLLLVPATGLGWVAAGYFGWGARIYRKHEGRLPWSSRFVLAPVLLGHWLSCLYYQRQCRPWDTVQPNLWIGRRLSESEAQAAIQNGVVAVLDLTAESSEAPAFLKRPYLNLPVLDLTAPSQEQLEQGIAFIREHIGQGAVYIHCKIGYSRSAALASAYLMAQTPGRTPDDAFKHLQNVRPSVVIRPEIRSGMVRFQETLGSEPPCSTA